MSDLAGIIPEKAPLALNRDASGTRGESFSVEIDSVADDAWDEIVGEFLDTNPEQTACYATRHWKGRDSHLLLRKDGKAVAGARVALLKLPLVGRGLAYLRFGPFWRRRDAEADPEIYRAVVAALVREYCTARGHCLTILPRPSPMHQAQELSLLREAGFVRRRQMLDAERYIVDVSLDEEAQMKSLSKTWRYNLRQALGNSLQIRPCDAPHEIEAFVSLYSQMMSRKQFDSRTPVHMTGELMADLPPALKPKLVLAFHNDSLVGGATVGLFGDTAYYMFGASSAAGLPLHAGYALQWWIIRWLRENGFEWYDLGGAAHEPGLRRFKKGFVGKAGRTVTMEGEYDRWTSSLGRVSADVAFGLRSVQRRIRHGRGFGRLSNR